MIAQWLEQTGLSWLHAIENETGFTESVVNGRAVRNAPATIVTQSRLGYCWSNLAHRLPQQSDFGRAARKSFQLLQQSLFAPNKDDFRVYDQSFYLLFMAWYFRITEDPEALQLLRNRYLIIERHLNNAGAGGFGPQPAGTRSHNPYMHLLEALLATAQFTRDDFWLTQARAIEDLFFTRLLDKNRGVVFEFLNADWSTAYERRIEIGHQMEWSALLSELYRITGRAELRSTAEGLYNFAISNGFENGLVIDAVGPDGTRIDRRKLLWVQAEAARHLSGDQALEHWNLIRQRFFHPNGWTWYNQLTPDNKPVEEPSNARLLYHVMTGWSGQSIT